MKFVQKLTTSFLILTNLVNFSSLFEISTEPISNSQSTVSIESNPEAQSNISTVLPTENYSNIQTNVSNTTKCYFFNEFRPLIGLVHTCYVNRSQKVLRDDLEIAFENLTSHESEIELFAAEGVQYMFMPKGLEKTFGSSLVGIEVTYASLEYIRQKDFKSHPNLRFLNFRGNFIKCIDKDTFSCNPKLEFISLRHNRIRRINPLVFVHLTALHYLWFSHNFCYYDDSNTIYEIPLAVKKIAQECMPIFKTIEEDLFDFRCSSLDASEIEEIASNGIYKTQERIKFKMIRDNAIKKAVEEILKSEVVDEEIRGLCTSENEV